jgi:thiosulfate dehydrogenase [quinone] large subunit
MNRNPECKWCDPRSAAVALGRWGMGMMFFFFGLGKLPDLNGFAEGLVKQFERTWLTPALVKPFGYVLPFAEVALGLFVMLGVFRNAALFATGVLLVLLAFGQALLGNASVVFSNLAYLFMTAALLFLAEYDSWVLFPRLHRPSSEPPA